MNTRAILSVGDVNFRIQLHGIEIAPLDSYLSDTSSLQHLPVPRECDLSFTVEGSEGRLRDLLLNTFDISLKIETDTGGAWEFHRPVTQNIECSLLDYGEMHCRVSIAFKHVILTREHFEIPIPKSPVEEYLEL